MTKNHLVVHDKVKFQIHEYNRFESNQATSVK